MKRASAVWVAGMSIVLATAQLAWAQPARDRGWKELGPRERYDALQNYRRYERLPEERQRSLDQGYERWRTLPPGERDRVRQNYERLQKLPPPQRQQFERKYEKWKRRTQPPP